MIGRLLHIAFGAAFVFCLLEVAARTYFFPQYTAMLPDMYATHPVLGHYTKPNLRVRRYNPMNYDVVNTTNSLGFRGSERNLPDELAGVWIAGASNTFGGYVEDDEVFATQLRKSGYIAANLASEGHGLPQQVLTVRYLTELKGFKPKAVIFSVSMYFGIRDYSNDLDVFSKPIQTSAPGPAARPLPRDNLRAGVDELTAAIPTRLQSLRARLLKTSALYGWLKVGIMGIPALRGWTLDLGLRNDLDLVRNFDLNLLRPLTNENPARADLVSTADYLAEIGRFVRERLGVPFGVVLLPAHHQLHPKSFGRFVSHYGFLDQDLDPLRPIRFLSESLRQRHIAVFDTLPPLQDSGLTRMTFPDDGHLTAAAHAVVGRSVATWIGQELGLPPGENQ